jgi:hypothetical protein
MRIHIRIRGANYYMKNKLKVGTVIGKKNSYEGKKALLEGKKQDLTVNFGQFSYYWIRDGKIRIRDNISDPQR